MEKLMFDNKISLAPSHNYFPRWVKYLKSDNNTDGDANDFIVSQKADTNFLAYVD